MITEKLQAYYDSLKGKKVFFLGAGRSHRQLIEKYAGLGAEVTLCDKKSLEQLGDLGKKYADLGVKFCLGDRYLDSLCDADIIFRTPGIDWTKPEIQKAIAAGVTVTSEMESFFDFCPCMIIGVTGSDGKTTTTTVIATVLKEAGFKVHLGGNLGVPLFPIIDEVEPADIAVVELSSFQLISMRKSPHIAVVTNVTPNHLDHHKDMAEYIGAKANIVKYQNYNDIAVFNAENDVTRDMSKLARGEVRWFSKCRHVGNGAFLDEQKHLWGVDCGNEYHVMDLNGIKLRGDHNKENLSTAYAAVKGLVDDETFMKVAKSFPGVEHRIEFVRKINDVDYYNDSIGTSPTRTIAGLRSFTEPMILIAGGYDKKISYAPLAEEIMRSSVKTVLLCGATAARIDEEIRKCDPECKICIEHLQDVPACVKRAHEIAVPGDVVFFSPASASFDLYVDFEARGRHFKQLVKDL